MDWDKSLLETLASTVERLEAKRNALLETKKEYEQLGKSLDKDASGSATYMVHLGGEYFAQMYHDEAKLYLQRRQQELNMTLVEFDSQLKHAKETMQHLTAFEEKTKELEVEASANEKVNEEGLPYVEILEELDEEGNVIGVKLNDENVVVEEGSNGKNATDETETVQETLNKDTEMSSAEDKPIELKELVKQKPIKENETDPDAIIKAGSDQSHQTHIDDEDAKQEISELISDMELSSSTPADQILFANSLLDKIDQLEISADDKFRLKEACMEQLSQQRSIDPSDIYELEMFDQMAEDEEIDDQDMAGEFGDDWDIEFDDDEEDEEEDEDADNDDDIKFFKHDDRGNSLLWDQIQKLRDAKKKSSEPLESSESDANKVNEKTKKKKGVKFADKVDVVPIENVSEEMKKMDIGRVSRFKLARNRQKESSTSFNPISDIHEKENPVSDIIEHANPVSDITENEYPVSDIIEHANPVSDITENEYPVSDIRENENPTSDTIENENVIEPDSTASTLDTPISDIIERDDINLHDTVTMPVIVAGQKSMPSVRRNKAKQDVEDIDEDSPVQAFRFNKEPEIKSTASRFRQAMSNTRTPKKAPIRMPQSFPAKSLKQTPVEAVEPDASEKEIVPAKEEPKVVKLDFGGDLDAMAQAYVMGMYDENDDDGMQPDIDATRGDYVISSVSDLDRHNQVVDLGRARSADQGENFAYMDDPDDSDTDEENGPIVSEDVLENEWEEPTSMDVDEDYGLSNEVLGQEVRQDYHRLRQKLAYENQGTQVSDAEKEFEPVYAEGERKPSRFKLMRMKMT